MKSQDVLSIKCQSPEQKQAYTAFPASFEAYLGSTLTPNQLIQQDLEELHPDEVEEMNLRLQMAMITYRSKMYLRRNRGYNMDINLKIRFDKTKVKFFNCNEYGHLSRECPSPRKVINGTLKKWKIKASTTTRSTNANQL